MSGREKFEQLVAELDYPMFVLTVADGGARSGCLVGFATQASIDPPRVIACISVNNRTHEAIGGASTVVVHLLSEQDTELAELFGGETGDDVDKFERCEWEPGPGEAPVLAGCPNWFAARVLERTEAGDHSAFLLEVSEAHRGDRPLRPLRFQQSKTIEPGHEP